MGLPSGHVGAGLLGIGMGSCLRLSPTFIRMDRTYHCSLFTVLNIHYILLITVIITTVHVTYMDIHKELYLYLKVLFKSKLILVFLNTQYDIHTESCFNIL